MAVRDDTMIFELVVSSVLSQAFKTLKTTTKRKKFLYWFLCCMNFLNPNADLEITPLTICPMTKIYNNNCNK